MKYFFWTFVLMITAVIGFNILDDHQSLEVADFEEEIKANPEKRRELFDAMEQSVTGKKRMPASELSQNYDLLKFINPSDRVQVLIGDLLISRRSGNGKVPMSTELKAQLKADPTKGFKSMKTLFEVLPFNEFPNQKTELITLVIEVNLGTPEEIKDLALSSLLADIPTMEKLDEEALPSSDLEKVNLTNMAYEAYLMNSNDPEMTLNETLKILEIHSDHLVRANIIDNFNQKFPSHNMILETMITESKMKDLGHFPEEVNSEDLNTEELNQGEGIDQ